eukprot:m.389973 g.389973  ORF g.389973 m.389973 type:complete len:451 (+) comp20074_c1_seq2:1334-2686(+)
MASVWNLAVIAAVVSVTQAYVPYDLLHDHKCDDGSTCPDADVCCPYGGGSGGFMCCQSAGPGVSANATCCDGGCCTAGEQCCSDDQGGTCCLLQSTYCVPKNPQYTYPARCCPRWTIGCGVGTVGCCDPANPWQISNAVNAGGHLHAKAVGVGGAAATATASSLFSTPEADELVAYVLFVTYSTLHALTVDIGSGHVLNKVPVDYDNNDESTREFCWDKDKEVFYAFDNNFTAPVPPAGRPLILSTINPKTGAVTRRIYPQIVNFPTGYSYVDGAGVVIVATEGPDSYDFWTITPSTGQAGQVATIARGSGEDSPGFYSGYHRAATPNASVVFRLGHLIVSSQTTPGLGVTQLGNNASLDRSSSRWETNVALAPNHGFYQTLHLVTTNSSSSRLKTAKADCPSQGSSQSDPLSTASSVPTAAASLLAPPTKKTAFPLLPSSTCHCFAHRA